MSKTEKQLMKEMFENAVASNDLDTMRGILKIGAKIKLEGHLYDSIKNRNVEAVKLLIEYGANPNNIKDPNYRGQYINALRLAMDGGNVSKEILEILLDIPSNPSLDIDPKIDISCDNGYLITALSVGVEKDILEMLISRGASTAFVFRQAIKNQDIEIIELLFNITSPPDEELELAFLESMYYDSTDVVRFVSSKLSAASIDKLKSDNRISVDKAKTIEIAEILFDLGFKIGFLNNRGYECIENIPSIEFLKFLLEKGMSPIINRNRYSYNNDPIYLGYLDDKDALKLFLEHGLDPNLIIHNFCHDQEIEFFKLLLSYSGADVNVKNRDNWTSLALAAYNNHLELAEFLISSGADLEAKTNGGKTPLHWAAERNHLELAQLLISSGADVNAKDGNDMTPLLVAARNNRLEIAKLLISSGADLEAKDNYGSTPLLLTAESNNLELAKLLISSGADLEAKSKNNNGWTPLHLAARRNSLELAELLISSGADLEAEDNGNKTPLHIVAEYNRPAVAELLISSGADLEAKTNGGWTPLHFATCNYSQAVAQLLISSGADVNAKRNDGFTPLHYVCNSVNIQMVEYLLKVGADPNITDVNGNAPLHTLGISECYASRQIRQSSRWGRYKYNNPDKKVIAEMLYKAGSSISIKNNQGKTPITIVKVYANDKYGNTTLKEFYDKEQEQMKQNLSSQVSAQVLTAPKKKTPRVSVSVKTEADLMKEIQEKIKNALSDA